MARFRTSSATTANPAPASLVKLFEVAVEGGQTANFFHLNEEIAGLIEGLRQGRDIAFNDGP
jgi:hypothetical protein